MCVLSGVPRVVLARRYVLRPRAQINSYGAMPLSTPSMKSSKI
jgi:hypothetical protein